LARLAAALRFRDSRTYWEQRYAAGGTSGAGSYGEQAEYKAAYLNAFVREHAVRSVIELGCGDGNQLRLAAYPKYLGVDASAEAVRRCIEAFRADQSKSFLHYDPFAFSDPAHFLHADLALSLDVIFHLVEDDLYEPYMRELFNVADRYVIIYATDRDDRTLARHVRYRTFTTWISERVPVWKVALFQPAPVAGYQDFYVFERRGDD
jgi:SAM-dependent methyltransferase